MEHLKILLLLIFLILFQAQVQCTDYYISNSGDDSNDGLTKDTAFETISAISSPLNTAGNSFFFKRGDTFRGKIVIKKESTTISDYGSGDLPVIKGSVVLGTWQKHDGNIWVIDAPSRPSDVDEDDFTIDMLFRDGEYLTVARHPDTGYYRIESASNKVSFTDSHLNEATSYWVDADVHVRSWSWLWEIRTVSSFSNGKVTWEDAMTGLSDTLYEGWGYYLDNTYKALDAENEWYYDSSNNKIYIYTESDPNSHTYEATIYDNGITAIWHLHDSLIENIEVQHYNNIGIYINQCDRVVVRNNRILWAGQKGSYAWSPIDYTFENNYIQYALDMGFHWGSSSDTDIGDNLISNNEIVDTSLICGRHSLWGGVGAKIGGNGVNFVNNKITNTASNGMGLEGGENTLDGNFVQNTCMCYNDCGVIYVKEKTNILNNHFKNPVGDMLASGLYNGKWFGKILFGIYFHTASDGSTVTGNTVEECYNAGLYSLDGINNKINENLFYNNGVSMITKVDNNDPGNNVLEDNIFFSAAQEQYSFSRSVDQNFGSFKNNKHISPLSSIHINADERYPLSLYQKHNAGKSTGSTSNNYHDYEQWHFCNNDRIVTWPLDSEEEVDRWGGASTISLSYDSETMGGSMKVTFNSASATTIYPNEDYVTQITRPYHIKFTIKAFEKTTIKLQFTEQNSTGWIHIYERVYGIEATERTYHAVFDSDVVSNNGKIRISSTEFSKTATIWIKDVSIEEIDANVWDVSSVYPLFCNEGTSSESFDLGTVSYMNVDGNNAGSSLTVPKKSCTALIRKDFTTATSTGRPRKLQNDFHTSDPFAVCPNDNNGEESGNSDGDGDDDDDSKTKSDDDPSTSGGAIAGIVILCIALVGMIIFTAISYKKNGSSFKLMFFSWKMKILRK
ncbi:secreted protein-related [Anaeramoeba flamelloides]|uniref:Secreted protein-related n=1 Tax=Anaeramoeba flamelloides TaxID=1746091 RepID=A0AAV7YSH8_9EUKA|nr:secreted protein-related [Anaeramoeba flamelloides]